MATEIEEETDEQIIIGHMEEIITLCEQVSDSRALLAASLAKAVRTYLVEQQES